MNIASKKQNIWLKRKKERSSVCGGGGKGAEPTNV